METVFDLAVIGGGINGCGVAADAASRGLSVILLEKDDLASKTSSSSSKLIHGGLRYLEHYDFSLVKKALNERELLLKLASHLVYPLSFVLPYQPSMRPGWLLRTGLFLYDHLSLKNSLPHAKYLQRSSAPSYFTPLADHFNKAFLFYDCATDDTRLTIANALQAEKYGATIRTRTTVIGATVKDAQWIIEITDRTQRKELIKAKAIVNATGPWITKMNDLLKIPTYTKITLVKGSHIIVPKLYKENYAYFLQHGDRRVIFIIPFHNCSMIGTTDVKCVDPLEKLSISPEEIHYLLNLANSYLKKPLLEKDIIHTWSGARTLLANEGKDLKVLSRDYVYDYTQSPAPAISIYGGKITTYRQLALEVVTALDRVFYPLKKSQTANIPLPGAQQFSDYKRDASIKYPWLTEPIRNRFLHSYGTRTDQLLKNCDKFSDLGYDFGCGLYQAEVDYLQKYEWALTAEDILWRRTKLGLCFNSTQKQMLEQYLRK